MPTYPSSASEVVDPEMEVERGSSSSSRHHSKKPPKGILKNSNPNATYLKSSSHSRHGGKTSGLNKRIEDLIEYETVLYMKIMLSLLLKRSSFLGTDTI